ncbi:hypothetical protein [Sphingomonas sp. CL5.1]|uniref:hypothetical protein n=1 Tax=Sphingomonas sp. CL5.1 TaxID=2653203 RepID=UPI0020C6906F|nr:hypothetical protein [Sphingomonas sp. CL5.1]
MMAFVAPAYEGLPTAIERLTATAKLDASLGAYPTAIVVGLPTYFILRRHFSARPLICAVAGAVVAALPWLFLVLVTSGASSASIGGQATIIDGHYAAYGWLESTYFIAQIALVGWTAGFLFWAIAAAGFKQPDGRR